MSIAERQSVSLMVMTTSLLLMLRNKDMEPVLNKSAHDAGQVTYNCMAKLPDGAEPFSTQTFLRQKEMVTKIFAMLPEKDTTFYAGTMIYLCSHIVTDLCEKIKDKAKLALLEPAQKACQELVDLYDRNGLDFAAMEVADVILRETYREIGFSRS